MKLRVRLLLLLALWPTLAPAQIEDLHRVSVPVAGQAPEDRAEAFRDALERVAVRLTGRQDAVDAVAGAGLAERAERFVQEYRYRTEETESQLVVRFDGTALRDALVREGVAVWQRDRPPVLVWLALDGPDGRYLVGDESPQARDALRESMAELGVPVLFPLLDLEDQRRISISDVTGGFGDPIRQASERYGAAVVLAGSVRADGNLRRARWMLDVDGQAENWNDLAPGSEELFDGMAREVASRLQAEYALLPDVDSGVEFHVWLLGIDDAARLAAAERALASTAGVEAVRAVTLLGDRVRFRLALSVSADRARRELGRSAALRAAEAVPASVPGDDGESRQPISDPAYRLDR